jgi:hypothetical protein
MQHRPPQVDVAVLLPTTMAVAPPAMTMPTMAPEGTMPVLPCCPCCNPRLPQVIMTAAALAAAGVVRRPLLHIEAVRGVPVTCSLLAAARAVAVATCARAALPCCAAVRLRTWMAAAVNMAAPPARTHYSVTGICTGAALPFRLHPPLTAVATPRVSDLTAACSCARVCGICCVGLAGTAQQLQSDGLEEGSLCC